MPNRLAHETSPYLLQHANNPVDWYPWGPEALERARAEDKPIFLSIGYSACHWCHVMEHESFENADIAKVMNDLFVNIKVDREERPDLDQIYMNAVQLMTQHGGWPMSVFLTPDLRPFYGGTYYPPTSRMGMPGFPNVLMGVSDAWKNRRDQVLESAGRLTQALVEMNARESAAGELTPEMLTDAAASFEGYFDFTHGGFGSAPKFPHAMDLRVLLRTWSREQHATQQEMIRLTLDKMAGGGIYDHLGGGFHRYSVDAKWLVPHFEKMLYDNALLAGCYTEAFQATQNPEYARVARETLDFILREMTHAEGPFYSTQDADSEGEEGKFYVWKPAEVLSVLGSEKGAVFNRVYDVSDAGNFEGHNILNLPKTLAQCAKILGCSEADLRSELAEGRARLLAVRSQRIWPGLDDKVLVSWNALAIEAMAEAAGPLAEPRYLAAARKAADFLLKTLRRADGRLLHSWRNSQAKFDAYLDDYAYLCNALVSLYEASFEERWIDEAVALADVMLAQFADTTGGGFYFTASDHEALITRNKDAHDASVPSASGMAATALLRLGKLTGRGDYLAAAEGTLKLYAELIERSPSAGGQMLIALDFYLGPTSEVVLLGDPAEPDTQAVLAALHARFLPRQVVALRTPMVAGAAQSAWLDPLFAGKDTGQATPATSPTLYQCQNFACQAPAVGRAAALAAIDALRGR